MNARLSLVVVSVCSLPPRWNAVSRLKRRDCERAVAAQNGFERRRSQKNRYSIDLP
jgi:hypothetical protein